MENAPQSSGCLAGCRRAHQAIADPLGHSSISITGNICGHMSDATTRAAVDGLTSALGI
jgi:hypothetical protein